MISVSTSSYPAMVSAAELQAARLGLVPIPKQSVPVQIQAPTTSGSASTSGSTSSQTRIVDVTV